MNLNGRQFREYAGGSVGGILRKNNANANQTTTPATAYTVGEARQVDLLVFGYACKIFRDDDKAREIDQGKHLIPWMGDNSHKIDSL
ncbi:protein suppressor of white apricot-like [Teleopsis dalmanni]|uniref:protein suppressor of white apricot-like n=1 Tax=Teleopsis dalmanni TaxID=139649 RepID=UPI0018CF6FBA|nr:protein suppressor of white apricot-like [Teleopsis dalmanni]